MSMNKETIIYNVSAGESILLAAQGATELARKRNTEVEFKFNDIVVFTTPTSNPTDISTIYMLKSSIRRFKAGYLED